MSMRFRFDEPKVTIRRILQDSWWWHGTSGFKHWKPQTAKLKESLEAEEKLSKRLEDGRRCKACCLVWTASFAQGSWHLLLPDLVTKVATTSLVAAQQAQRAQHELWVCRCGRCGWTATFSSTNKTDFANGVNAFMLAGSPHFHEPDKNRRESVQIVCARISFQPSFSYHHGTCGWYEDLGILKIQWYSLRADRNDTFDQMILVTVGYSTKFAWNGPLNKGQIICFRVDDQRNTCVFIFTWFLLLGFEVVLQTFNALFEVCCPWLPRGGTTVRSLHLTRADWLTDICQIGNRFRLDWRTCGYYYWIKTM